MDLLLRVKTDTTKAGLRRLRDKYPVAVARALNRATASARTVMVRGMAADMGLKQAVIRKDIVTTEASAGRLFTRLAVSGAPIPLIHFSAKGPYPSRGRGRGVSYRLPGSKGRIADAFIAQMASGHRGVFRRVGRARLPIVELHGPSLPKVFEKVSPAGLAHGEASLQKNLIHELKWALQQAAPQ